MSESFAKETFLVSLEEEMKQSYLDYAMSVIVRRALPDVRDGMKPVHRRVLYAMHELDNHWNKPFKKSARIVGDVVGKYHPHGEIAIYDTVVRMVQDFTMRYQLIDGQGNFGSIDGDGAASMRYTEIRMHKITQEILADLDKETVDFMPNYSNTDNEPVIFPAKLPVLLLNGSSGIAVGMATNIPPHNISEVVNGCLAVLDNENISVDELIDIIPAPDFPTGATIHGVLGVREGYKTGRGRIVIRGKTHIEPIHNGGREAIIIDEIPYQVNKSKLVEKIGILVSEKTIEGISDLRDESDKSGIRIVIELKRNENAEVILNQLYKLTQLQDTFGMNMIALVNGYPKQLNLKDFIVEFLKHRREVVYRRTVFELKKARGRAHILEGLAVALANVDEIVQLIKSSRNPSEAKAALLAKSWPLGLIQSMLEGVDTDLIRPEDIDEDCGLKSDGYYLSKIQAQAILDMRLQRLTGLEQDKIISEYKELIEIILDLSDILANRERITQIIRDELIQIKTDFGDARRTEIETTGGDIDDEDLIPTQQMIVTLSHAGYIKAQPAEDYQSQNRGGRGKQATVTKNQDFIKALFVANTHDYLLCFTSLGKCYQIKVYKLPVGSRNSRGRPVANVLNLAENETISAILPVKEFTENEYVLMCTKLGFVKKISLMNFSKLRSHGITTITLSEQDSLVGVVKTSGTHEVMLFSNKGKSIRFDEANVRSMGRLARGVRAMKLLEEGDKIISLLAIHPELDKQAMILAATANGYGKRTHINGYRKYNRRGSKGVIAIDTGERNGMLVAVTLVEETDDVMLITSGGVLIRTPVNKIRETSRTAQGVRLINLDQGEVLVSMEKLAEVRDEDNKNETEKIIH